MKKPYLTFLEETLGTEGTKALMRAADRSKQLENALLPRAVLAWLGVVGRVGYEGAVPGLENSNFKLQKTEDTYSGEIAVGVDKYSFNSATLYHVAATLAVSLGAESQELSKNLREIDALRLGQSIDLLAKIRFVDLAKYDKLEKMGAMARLAPFNPNQVTQNEANKLNRWQAYETAGGRAEILPMEPHARLRALHKLSATTPTRRNPTTGEREFMLHRGMDQEEWSNRKSVDHKNHYNFNTMSSWSPHIEVADSFKDMAGKGGRIASAWVPEHAIHHIPNQYGNMSEKLSTDENPLPPNPNEFASEYEVITKPSTQAFEEIHPKDVLNHVHQVGDLDHRINQRAERKPEKQSKLGELPAAPPEKPHWGLQSAVPNVQKTELPGQSARGWQPEQQVAPVTPSMQQQKGPPKTSSTLKLPGSPKPAVIKKTSLMVSKSEAATPCNVCKGVQFNAKGFKGCICFVELAKSVKITSTSDDFLTLEFGKGWGPEEILTLRESLGK